MKTVLEVITSTATYFQKNAVESPRLNIEHLLAHVLGKKRMDLYMEFDRPLTDEALAPLRDLVRRRARGEPLQHLLGTADFLGRSFLCDKRALIPRPETEQLCEMILLEHKGEDFTGRIVDVGTGSGILALSLAAALPNATVEGVDLSPDALALAGENRDRLRLESRVELYESDLLASVAGGIHLLVANLPYIPAADIPTLSREVRRDPHSALIGGPRGTELIERLAAEASTKLQGRMALEIGLDQAARVVEILEAQKYRDIRVASDYQERPRFVFSTHG